MRRKENGVDVCGKKCFHRVLDVSLVFDEKPSLIIANICLFDQNGLANVFECEYWGLIERVRLRNMADQVIHRFV